MRVAIQMDPIGSINPKSDTTLLLGAEACARGYEVYYYTPEKLHWKNGVKADAHRITLRMDEKNYHELGEIHNLNLSTMDVILLRQDPPFDMGYMTTTYLLERLNKTLVVNDPFHVRNNVEKLFPLQFPEFIPPTLVTSQADDIKTFYKEHGDIVIKPLYGFGGHSIFRIGKDGTNLNALTEMLSNNPREPLVAQKFLPEVATGERRIVMIHGKVEGVFGRIPADQEIRSNMRVGGTPAKAELTKRQRELCEALGPVLLEKGLLLAGVDMIGDYLTEINITSPTGLQALKKLYGATPEKTFWDGVRPHTMKPSSL